MEELKQKCLSAAGDAMKPPCDTTSPTSTVEPQGNEENVKEDEETDKVISANGNTLIDRDNVLLPTTNDTNYNKDKLKENIKDVSIKTATINKALTQKQ